MTQDPKPTLQIFCKAPIVGEVKTRLVPYMDAECAKKLHENLATRILDMCCSTEITDRVNVELWCSPSLGHPFYEQFNLDKKLQLGADLGERMFNAMASTSAPVILIGTDCPNLDANYLLTALDKLQDHDAVLGPAEDGGYGLIGMQQANWQVFTDINWSTSTVCTETCDVFNILELNWALLPLLWDVDRKEDVERYMATFDANNIQTILASA